MEPDAVQSLLDYLTASDLEYGQLSPILDRLEPIIKMLYDLKLTLVVPHDELPTLCGMFS